ncbi:precorrin-6A/cobalt-precorrin-6A reductase [Jannaschia faecimaris]|uniref:precorrin-6A/cobalt-precorrin-6A reductase n=1 Tax=Jannaschia faecimaris TaxID=1244108 RepID=UPI000A487ED8|nr:precorrin-6A/cobalt-precorrin-6A reductase [Jannaschia faecimaris]
MTGKVLILAGTREARLLCASCGGLDVLASLAGATEAPRDLHVPTRVGGFGGASGFVAALDGVSAVLDATHPYAAAITRRTVRICGQRDIPYLRLARAPFAPDWTWTRHADAGAAADALPSGAAVFLATGPGTVEPFLDRGLTLHCRRIDPAPAREGVNWIVGAPPFTDSEERALLALLGVTHLVAKDSGGDRAKLNAAGDLGIAVHIIDRPAHAGGEETHDIDQALAFVRTHARKLADH